MTPKALAEAKAQQDLGHVPSYRDLKMTPKFAQAVLGRVEISARIKELEANKDGLSEYLMGEVALTGLKAVMVDAYKVQIVDSDRTRIDPERLLELGVSADAIQKAMVTTHSTYLKVDDTEARRVRGQEQREGVQSIKKGGKR